MLHVVGRIAPSKPVRQKIVQVHLLLLHEAGLAELAQAVQVDHGAHARGGGELDGGPDAAQERGGVDGPDTRDGE